MKDLTRLNIEIASDLQKNVKEYTVKKNISIRDFITNLIKKELNKNSESINKFRNSLDKFTVALICGGPSKERGISLNSARSVADHLSCKEINVEVYYLDQLNNFYKIDKKELYSNTPSDFDFKLQNNGIKLSNDKFIENLNNVSIVFPLIHGEFGEDGQLQKLLEENNIPFVGSSSSACYDGFSKINASKILRDNGFFTFPFVALEENIEENKEIIKRFFEMNNLKKAVVKPANGGSSIGVYCVYSYLEATEKVEKLFNDNLFPIIIEPFCKGREFTTIVLQSLKTREPVALIPSEIEMKYENYQIFDYRKKYLPTEQIRSHTPPRFTDEEIEKIRKYSEKIFDLMKFENIVRIDGWLLDDGRIWFSDINISSGMEQNSFVFQQSTRCGLTHSDLVQYVLKSACLKYGLNFPKIENNLIKKKEVNILFGGDNAERQVSLMSGTNVWLKLQKSSIYKSKPFLLDKDFNIWYLPYMYCLNHTVEEIIQNCIEAKNNLDKLRPIVNDVCLRLGLSNFSLELPIKYTFDEFVKLSKSENAFVFLALHGGKGEDGTIQEILDNAGLKYNGSDKNGSKLGMDKYKTGEIIENLHDQVLISAPKNQFCIKDFENFLEDDYLNFWNNIVKKLNSTSFIIKPARDGSSAGAVRVYEANDLKIYVELLKDFAPYIPANTFRNQKNIIEMPSNCEQPFLLESFIITDDICIKNNEIKHIPTTNWLELTVGVLEKDGVYHSFNPSITIAENSILTIEEKFQGGTGVNITPPPTEIIGEGSIDIIKLAIEKAAKVLGIKNYARLDIFFNTKTKKVILIEANTLPALTPSTVIYHQALTEEKSLTPIEFLETIIKNVN